MLNTTVKKHAAHAAFTCFFSNSDFLYSILFATVCTEIIVTENPLCIEGVAHANDAAIGSWSFIYSPPGVYQ